MCTYCFQIIFDGPKDESRETASDIILKNDKYFNNGGHIFELYPFVYLHSLSIST